ncbi:cytochrome P450 [Spongiactinospora sp. TRM90649]|uniref:cytochrome P450 family protein n=1 Tax=Spongiactinospora sp. TRM90649 TaxID=3031114 RepID=UPI0023F68FB3|nr:cytochrome P450 [Spongiactinospora sp. TRM90649]MDF5759131.1 cytochrome P450 [Spongiactinospora sp. TRM90649]
MSTPSGTGPIDMMDPDLLRDPFQGYSRIREEAPATQGVILGQDTPVWLVTRYDDVKTVLSDQRFVNDPAAVPGGEVANLREKVVQARGIPQEYAKYVLDSILDADGADHLRLRRLVSRAFTARRVLELRPRVEEITEGLLAALPGKAGPDGVVDLLEHFAYPLPITVICELVGIPEEDRASWHDWGRGLLSLEPGAMSGALVAMVDHIEVMVARRREEPAEDLLTALIRVHDEDGDRLGTDELITMVLTLVLAGHETTAHLIGNGTVALLTHPDQLARLRAEPELVPRAVHELMRWCGPVQGARLRYATEAVEIGGVKIGRGEPVMAMLVAANYDPRRFGDPDRLDIAREPEGHRETHVGFGAGLHYCLGAALARQEGEVAFSALFRRYPGLALAVEPDALERQYLPSSWRLARLPVRLDG